MSTTIPTADGIIRSPDRNNNNTDFSSRVGSDGITITIIMSSYVYYSCGRRPAFVLPASLSVDDSGDVVTNQPPTAPGSIDVQNVVSGGTTTITITSATDSDGTVTSYRYERSVDGAGFTQFSNTSALSVEDHIDVDWGTVQYRVCAVDDQGSTGPYVTSENYTINDGYIILGGPQPNMGVRDNSFTFSALLDVSGFDDITDITVNAFLDGESVLSDTLDQGQSVEFYVDTRAMAPGEHKIRVTAEHESVLPAMQDYTFTISTYELPSGGRTEQFEDEYCNAIFPVTMTRNVVDSNNRSVQNDIDDLKKRHHGENGHIEHVDTAYGVTSYNLNRESGVVYSVEIYPQNANGAAFPMMAFCIPNGFNSEVNLGSIGTVNASESNIVFTMANTTIVKIGKFVSDK